MHDDGSDARPAADARLGYLLRHAAAAHRLHVDRALADLDVTAPQFLILTLLVAHSGLSNADLARRTGQSMPTVSAIVQRLKAAGMVESRSHPVHGRIRNLSLTALGRQRHAQCDIRVQAIEQELEALLLDPMGQPIVTGWLRRVSEQP